MPLFVPDPHVASTANPGVTDDVDSGNAIGTLWTNSAAGTVYVCVDATAGAAVWKEVDNIGTTACEVWRSQFTNYVPVGASDPFPWDSETYKTVASIHDGTVADSGTATGVQTSTTLQDTTKTWTVNQFVGGTVYTKTGTGLGRWRTIASNTSNTLTLSTAWIVTPDSTTTYEITMLSTRLTIPVDGVYYLTSSMGFSLSSVASDVTGMQIFVNGLFRANLYQIGSTATEYEHFFARTFKLVANDYLELKVYNGTASEHAIFCGRARTFFSIARQV